MEFSGSAVPGQTIHITFGSSVISVTFQMFNDHMLLVVTMSDNIKINIFIIPENPTV